MVNPGAQRMNDVFGPFSGAESDEVGCEHPKALRERSDVALPVRLGGHTRPGAVQQDDRRTAPCFQVAGQDAVRVDRLRHAGRLSSKIAKHLLELKTSVVTISDHLSCMPSSSVAPVRQNQLSISC